MDDPYRDPLVGLYAEIGLLRSQIQELERAFTAALWEHLPPDFARRLEELRGQTGTPAEETHETLSALARALEALLAALTEARNMAPQLEQALATPAPGFPDIPLPKPSLTLALDHDGIYQTGPLIENLHRIAPLGLKVVIEEIKAGGLYTHFTFEGAPFALLARPPAVSRTVLELSELSLATHVPRALPELRLRPEGLRHSLLLKPLGLTWEAEVGDTDFDGRFLVQGSESPLMILTEEVREALLGLAYYDIPRLEVSRGKATLRWSYSPDLKVLRAALLVLQRIRVLPGRIRLLM